MALNVERAVYSSIEELTGRSAAHLNHSARLDDDLRIDSLDFVRLVQSIEEGLDIQLDDEELAPVKDLGQLLSVVARAAARAGGSCERNVDQA